MRIPFTDLDGFSSHSQFYNDYINESERQLRARLLARTLSRGVAEGYVVSDVASPGVTGVNITSGLAYNDQGFRTFLSGDTFLQLSHLDIGKYVTVWPTELTGQLQTHPVLGTQQYSSVYDSVEVSAVLSPDSSIGQVKLALIQDVIPGATPEVDLRAIDLVDRDPLLASPPFPYVTVGNAGADTDFEGNTEQVFLDAFDALTATSGGVVYVKKGFYDMQNSGGYTVSGFDTIHILGEGKGTRMRFSGTDNSDFRFWNNKEVIIEGLSMWALGVGDNGWWDFRDTDVVRFRGNYCSGKATQTNVMSLGSGLTSVWITDNVFKGGSVASSDKIWPMRCYRDHPAGSVGDVYFSGNLCSGRTIFQFGEQMASLNITDNMMESTSIMEDQNPIPLSIWAGTTGTPPGAFNFSNNIWVGGPGSSPNVQPPKTSCPGAVIHANHFWMPHIATVVGVHIVDSTGVSGDNGRYSNISANVFFHRRQATGPCINVPDTNSSGVAIDGNVCIADGSSGSQKAITATGRDSVVDGNICYNFGVANTGGTNTWISNTNTTSNKEF